MKLDLRKLEKSQKHGILFYIKYNGNTLVSLNTTDVLKEHNRVSKLEVFNITNIQHIPSIPLDSFFFKDKEGHDFEIQQFIKEEDISVFYSR